MSAGHGSPCPRLLELLAPDSAYAGPIEPLLQGLPLSQVSRVPVRQILARQPPLPPPFPPLPAPLPHYLHLLRQTLAAPPFSFTLSRPQSQGVVVHCVGESGSLEVVSGEEARLLREREAICESICEFVERES